MNCDQITKELDNLTRPRSDFEFEMFFLGQYPTPARQLIAVMEEMEKYATIIQTLQSGVESTHSEGITKWRKIDKANKIYNQLNDWYQKFTPTERAEILKNFENEEPEYWANVLGRRTALEVLSQKQASVETMDQMIKLPRELFETATAVCNDYIQMITDVIKNVEERLDNPVLGVPFDS
jgi:hypothetical protein